MNMDVEITVCRADIEDAEILTETCKRAFDSDSEVGAPGPGGPPGYDSIEWNRSKIVNPYLQYYKILKGETIAGGFIAGDRGPGYHVCERIWVDPVHMREGIGQRAFEIIWDGYPQADLWALGTPEWNVRTNSFYQKLGFVKIGTTHDYPHWNGNYYEKSITNGFPRAMSTIEALRPGMNQVVVEGRVETMQSPRTVYSRKKREELKVINAILRDGTGSIRLVLWNDQIRQVKEHSRIRLENGYVREYRDDIQLGVGEWGVIITLV